MQQNQQAFIQFAIDQGVLKFGDYTLKSGRKSPYFFNAGLFNSGRAISMLGRFYADAIVQANLEFDILFGPAYKGIPLVCATAIALAEHHGRDIPWCFNRKEVKDHGEGGSLVGAPLQGNVLVVDDVITAGTAINEASQIIEDNGASFKAVVIAIDRQERGQGGSSAIREVADRYAVDIVSVARLDDLMQFLQASQAHAGHLQSISDYQALYGV